MRIVLIVLVALGVAIGWTQLEKNFSFTDAVETASVSTKSNRVVQVENRLISLDDDEANQVLAEFRQKECQGFAQVVEQFTARFQPGYDEEQPLESGWNHPAEVIIQVVNELAAKEIISKDCLVLVYNAEAAYMHGLLTTGSFVLLTPDLDGDDIVFGYMGQGTTPWVKILEDGWRPDVIELGDFDAESLNNSMATARAFVDPTQLAGQP